MSKAEATDTTPYAKWLAEGAKIRRGMEADIAGLREQRAKLDQEIEDKVGQLQSLPGAAKPTDVLRPWCDSQANPFTTDDAWKSGAPGFTRQVVHMTLVRMANDGAIEKLGRGIYQRPEAITPDTAPVPAAPTAGPRAQTPAAPPPRASPVASARQESKRPIVNAQKINGHRVVKDGAEWTCRPCGLSRAKPAEFERMECDEADD